jgi:hypothetical protein
MKPEVSLLYFKNLPLDPILSQLDQAHTPTSNFFKILFDSLLTYAHFFQVVLPLQVFWLK